MAQDPMHPKERKQHMENILDALMEAGRGAAGIWALFSSDHPLGPSVHPQWGQVMPKTRIRQGPRTRAPLGLRD